MPESGISLLQFQRFPEFMLLQTDFRIPDFSENSGTANSALYKEWQNRIIKNGTTSFSTQSGIFQNKVICFSGIPGHSGNFHHFMLRDPAL